MDERLEWTKSPDFRGTINILWTCISTLGLCVWTAVHPDVRMDGNWLKSTLERAGLMILAIILPEVIVCSAWNQLLTAKRICKELSRIQRSKDHVKQGTTESTFDLKGKGILKKRDAGVNSSRIMSCGPSPSSSNPRVTDPALRLLHPETSFDLYDDSQGDLSRTSTGTPFFSSAQQNGNVAVKDQDSSKDWKDARSTAEWSMNQAFFVTMGGFIVSTPETGVQRFTAEGILTLAKVGLLPQLNDRDVRDRNKADTIAKGIVFVQLSWFLLEVLGRLVARLPVTLLEAHTSVHVVFTALIFALWFQKPYNVQYPIAIEDADSVDMACLFEFDARRRKAYSYELHQYTRDKEQSGRPQTNDARESQNHADQCPASDPPELGSLTQSLARCVTELDHGHLLNGCQNTGMLAVTEGANRAVERLRRFDYSTDMLNAQHWDFLQSSSMAFTIGSTWGAWSKDDGHSWSLDKLMHMIFNILYGAGHMTVWHSTSFPTAREKGIWRACAITLCSVPIWGLLWMLWWRAVNSTRRLLLPFRNGDLDHVAASVFLNVVCSYIFARCFFLIECLISLRSQPAGAYQIEQWTTVVPHVG